MEQSKYVAEINAKVESNLTQNGVTSVLASNARTNDPDPVTREALYRAAGDCAQGTAYAHAILLRGERRTASY